MPKSSQSGSQIRKIVAVHLRSILRIQVNGGRETGALSAAIVVKEL